MTLIERHNYRPHPIKWLSDYKMFKNFSIILPIRNAVVEIDYLLLSSIASVIVQTAIVILLVKTVKDAAEVARASKIQSKHRFRPWVGPTTGIEFMREFDGRYQFSVAIKNFGELPATSVIASSVATSEVPSRALASVDAASSEKWDRFVLGPLLPNMEKKYWIFVNIEMMRKAKDGEAQLYTLVVFRYEYDGGKSNYAMISQYDPKTNIFVHKDMWIE